MFCPDIGKECMGEGCRDWHPKTGRCRVQDQEKISEKFTKAYFAFAEQMKFETLWSKLMVNRILADPTVDPETKEVLRQALQAPSSEVAEKLLKEAKLLPED